VTTATAAPEARAAGVMPLAGHLKEARRRGSRAAVAVGIAVIVGFLLSDHVLDILRPPIEELARSREASLNYDTVTGAFDLKVTIAVFSGIVLSSPVWLTELFGFVTPGLTRREKRFAYGFAAAAAPLFAAGCAFGIIIFPRMVGLLTGFSSDQDSTILNVAYYADFVMKIVLAIGIAFVLPVFLVMLNFLGLVSARTLRRGWRVIVVVIALFSALVTPAADVFSMFLVAVPMSLLFGTALLVTHLHDMRAARRAAG